MSDFWQDQNSSTFAEEAFVVDVQSFLQRLMNEKGMNRSQLATAMGVSKARITHIFSDECKNFTVRLLARACFALGESPRISSGLCDDLDQRDAHQEQCKLIEKSSNVKWLESAKSEHMAFSAAHGRRKLEKSLDMVVSQSRDQSKRMAAFA